MKNKITLLFLICLIVSSITTPVFAQETEDYPIYIVQSGDTLGQIAALFDVTVDELILTNNISDPNSIYPGLSLKIPGLPGITGNIIPTIVALGESWNNILIQYQADEETLIKINHLLNSSGLYAGTNLLLPVRADTPELTPKAILDNNSTFLEKSIFLNSNPIILMLQNRKESPLLFFSNDLLFNNNPNQKTINPFSTAIESLSVTPLPLTQGDTVLVHLAALQPLTLRGQVNGHELNFYTTDSINYFALQGIHAMATPGLTDFSISGSDGSKEVFNYQQNILLSSGNFEIDDPLTVAPEMIDPAVTGPELAKVEEIISVFTPIQYWDGIFLSPDNDYSKVIANYDQVKEITSFFGSRRTYNDNPEVTFHAGVDFGGGETLPIVAPAAGKVVFAGFLDVRGNATIIDHGLGVYSAYFHQSVINVQIGDMVEKGQKIGEVGNTGRVDRADEYEGAGAHLHWEMWVNGVQVNPLDWLNSEYP